MSYTVTDSISLDILFNGKPFPFGKINTLSFGHISSSCLQSIPMLNLGLTDGLKWLVTSGSLADASTITVILQVGNRNSGRKKVMDFTLAHFQDSIGPGGIAVYKIEAYGASPKYLSGSSSKPIQGTSQFVLDSIAKACGLTFLGVGTNDDQIWYPGNRPFHVFANYVSEHGFATDNSCMSMALDISKTMVYRDITSMDAPVATLGYLDLTTKGVIPFTSFTPIASPGALNASTGYNAVTYEQTVNSEFIHTKQEKVGVILNDQGQPLINQKVKGSLEQGRVVYSPISNGNVHEKFERAYHQNTRVTNLFTSSLELVTPFLSDLMLLDTVSVSMSIAKAGTSPAFAAYEGSYRVTTKVLYFTPGEFCEKLSLGRRTLNTVIGDNSALAATSSNSIISSPSEQLERTLQIKSKIPSLADFVPFDPQFFVNALQQVGPLLGQSIGQSISTAVTASASTAAAASSGNSIIALLNTLQSTLTGHTALGVSEIQTYRSTVLDTDPAYQTGLDAVLLTANNRIVTAISSALPDIQRSARRASTIASVGAAVNEAASSLSSAVPTLQQAVNQSMQGFSLLSGQFPGVTSGVQAVVDSVSNSASSAVSQVSSQVSMSGSMFDDLLDKANSFQSIISAASASASSAFTQAAVA